MGRKTKFGIFLFLTPQNLYLFEYQRNTTHFLIEWKRVGSVDVILITTNLEISFKARKYQKENVKVSNELGNVFS